MKYLQKKRVNQIANCGYGKGYSIKQVVEIFKSKKYKNFNYDFDKKRVGDISYMVADTKKLNRIIKWKAKYSNLKKMIESEINWKKKF